MHSCCALHFPWRQKSQPVCSMATSGEREGLGEVLLLWVLFNGAFTLFPLAASSVCSAEPQLRAPPRVSPGDPVYGVGGHMQMALGTFPVWSLSCPSPQRHLLLYKYLKASCTCAQPSAAKFSPSTEGRGHQLIPVTCWDWRWLSPTPTPPLHLQGKGNMPKTLVSLCWGHINSSVTSSPSSFLFHPTEPGPSSLCCPISPSVLCLFQVL